MCATRVLKGTQQGGVGVCMQAERVRASRADIKHFAELTPENGFAHFAQQRM